MVLALPKRQQVIKLEVDEACSAREAVELAKRAGLRAAADEVDIDAAPLGVYGERVADEAPLRTGDRVEIYRPLQQDPMELRRQRAALESGRLPKRRK